MGWRREGALTKHAERIYRYFIKNVKQLKRSRYKDDTVRSFFLSEKNRVEIKWQCRWRKRSYETRERDDPMCRGICNRRCPRWAPEESTPLPETGASESPRDPPLPWGRAANFRPQVSLYRSRTIYDLWSARPAARGSRKRLAIPSAAWISANVSFNPFIT